MTVFEQSLAAEAGTDHADTPRPLTPAACVPAALETDITLADLQAATTAAALTAVGDTELENEEPAEEVDVLMEELMVSNPPTAAEPGPLPTTPRVRAQLAGSVQGAERPRPD